MVLHRHDSAPAALQLLFGVVESAGVVGAVVNRHYQSEVLDLALVEKLQNQVETFAIEGKRSDVNFAIGTGALSASHAGIRSTVR